MIKVSIEKLIDKLQQEALNEGKCTIDFLFTLLSLDENQDAANCILKERDQYLKSLRQKMVFELEKDYGEEGIKLLKDEMSRVQQIPTIREKFKICLLGAYYPNKSFYPVLHYGKYLYYKFCLENIDLRIDNVHEITNYAKLREFQKIEEQKYLDFLCNSLRKYYKNS